MSKSKESCNPQWDLPASSTAANSASMEARKFCADADVTGKSHVRPAPAVHVHVVLLGTATTPWGKSSQPEAANSRGAMFHRPRALEGG
eukprot:120882-Pyramimonas_sp.AAC.1